MYVVAEVFVTLLESEPQALRFTKWRYGDDNDDHERKGGPHAGRQQRRLKNVLTLFRYLVLVNSKDAHFMHARQLGGDECQRHGEVHVQERFFIIC